MNYRLCVKEGKAGYNSAGLLRCDNPEKCISRLRLEQGNFCKQPLLDENKGRRWPETPPANDRLTSDRKGKS